MRKTRRNNMRIGEHHKQAANLSRAERWLSALAGEFLVGAGVRRLAAPGFAVALAGADLVRRAVTGPCFLYQALGLRTAPRGQGASISVPYELGVGIDRSIVIDRLPREVYGFWR